MIALVEVGIADLVCMAAGAVAIPLLLQDRHLRLVGDVLIVMRFPALFPAS